VTETGRRSLWFECIEDDLGAHVVGEFVAEDPRGPLVTHGAQVGLTVADREIGDVARPELVDARQG
jgi:hypothetical protein